MNLNDPDLLRALDDQAKALESAARGTRAVRALIAADADPIATLPHIAAIAAGFQDSMRHSAMISNLLELIRADEDMKRGDRP